ncbi:MAG: phage tail tape measure protein, partial [Finegoldia magna]|nr:phage tail tape measure protein [Finegoldia magna]
NADTIAPQALEVVGRLADGFMKALPKLWEIGKDLVKNVAKGLKENPEVVAEAVPAILKAFATAMLLFQGADVAKGMLKSLASGLIGNGGMMQAPAQGVLGHLTKAFNGGGSKLVTAGKDLLGKLTEGFSKTTAPLIKAGKDTVDYLGIAILEGKDKLLAPAKGLVDIVGNTISKVGSSSLVQSGLGLVTKIGTGITSGFGKITALASKIIPLITAVLSNPVGLVIAGGLLIGAILKGFNVDIPKLTHSAGEIVGKIAGTISNGAEKLVGVGKSLIGKIGEGWDSLKDTFADIKANGLINTLGEKFKSGIDTMKQAGSGFIQGIKDGWDSRKGEVTDETSQLPNQINESIDPTTTQQTGQTMIEGIIEGLKWGETSVAEAYNQLIQ